MRETWAAAKRADGSQSCRVAYQADGKCVGCGADGSKVPHGWLVECEPTKAPSFGLAAYGGRWRSPIHMPRWASRITLEVTDVRVERLQDISEEDAEAEGMRESIVLPGDRGSFVPEFADLWHFLNEKRGFGWDTNPWVWVVEWRGRDERR